MERMEKRLADIEERLDYLPGIGAKFLFAEQEFGTDAARLAARAVACTNGVHGEHGKQQ